MQVICIVLAFSLLALCRGASLPTDPSKLEQLLMSSAESSEKEEASPEIRNTITSRDESGSLAPSELDPAVDESSGIEGEVARAKKSYNPPGYGAPPPAVPEYHAPAPVSYGPPAGYPAPAPVGYPAPAPAVYHAPAPAVYPAPAPPAYPVPAPPAYLAPAPAYPSYQTVYHAPQVPYPVSKPYSPTPFCVEIRPKHPGQAPFIVCETPHASSAHYGPSYAVPAPAAHITSTSSVQHTAPIYSAPYVAHAPTPAVHASSSVVHQTQAYGPAPPAAYALHGLSHQGGSRADTQQHIVANEQNTHQPGSPQSQMKPGTEQPPKKEPEGQTSPQQALAAQPSKGTPASSRSSYEPIPQYGPPPYNPYAVPHPPPPPPPPGYKPAPSYDYHPHHPYSPPAPKPVASPIPYYAPHPSYSVPHEVHHSGPIYGVPHPGYPVPGHPLTLSCQLHPHYVHPPHNPYALLQLYVKPGHGGPYESPYREVVLPEQSKTDKPPSKPKAAEMSQEEESSEEMPSPAKASQQMGPMTEEQMGPMTEEQMNAHNQMFHQQMRAFHDQQLQEMMANQNQQHIEHMEEQMRANAQPSSGPTKIKIPLNFKNQPEDRGVEGAPKPKSVPEHPEPCPEPIAKMRAEGGIKGSKGTDASVKGNPNHPPAATHKHVQSKPNPRDVYYSGY